MRKFRTAAAAALLVVALPSWSSAQQGASPRERLVVTPAWLAQHLDDRDLVILQVGRKETYDAGHVPGARFVNFDAGALAAPMDRSGRDPNQLRLEMPAPEALRRELASLGISDRSRIVVVASDEYWSPSTRVVLTLDHAGLTNVSWLDGGLKGWTDAGRALSTSAPPAVTGTLGPLRIAPVVVDAEFVKAHIRTPGFAIVDARTRNFYDGAAGHIPGALSAPFNEFAAGGGGLTRLKSDEEIKTLLARAGVKPGDTIIAYCHIGQQATATLFAARTAGYKVRLYDGSFTDWQRRDLPIEK